MRIEELDITIYGVVNSDGKLVGDLPPTNRELISPKIKPLTPEEAISRQVLVMSTSRLEKPQYQAAGPLASNYLWLPEGYGTVLIDYPVKSNQRHPEYPIFSFGIAGGINFLAPQEDQRHMTIFWDKAPLFGLIRESADANDIFRINLSEEGRLTKELEYHPMSWTPRLAPACGLTPVR